MKKRDIAELKTKSISELEKKLAEFETEIAKVNLELKMGKTKNVHSKGAVKRDFARTMTLLRLKQLEEKEKQNVTS